MGQVGQLISFCFPVQVLGRVLELQLVGVGEEGGQGTCLSYDEFGDKGENTKTGSGITKIQGSKVGLGLAHRRLQ